jgi:hypothetical protein
MQQLAQPYVQPRAFPPRSDSADAQSMTRAPTVQHTPVYQQVRASGSVAFTHAAKSPMKQSTRFPALQMSAAPTSAIGGGSMQPMQRGAPMQQRAASIGGGAVSFGHQSSRASTPNPYGTFVGPSTDRSRSSTPNPYAKSQHQQPLRLPASQRLMARTSSMTDSVDDLVAYEPTEMDTRDLPFHQSQPTHHSVSPSRKQHGSAVALSQGQQQRQRVSGKHQTELSESDQVAKAARTSLGSTRVGYAPAQQRTDELNSEQQDESSISMDELESLPHDATFGVDELMPESQAEQELADVNRDAMSPARAMTPNYAQLTSKPQKSAPTLVVVDEGRNEQLEMNQSIDAAAGAEADALSSPNAEDFVLVEFKPSATDDAQVVSEIVLRDADAPIAAISTDAPMDVTGEGDLTSMQSLPATSVIEERKQAEEHHSSTFEIEDGVLTQFELKQKVEQDAPMNEVVNQRIEEPLLLMPPRPPSRATEVGEPRGTPTPVIQAQPAPPPLVPPSSSIVAHAPVTSAVKPPVVHGSLPLVQEVDEQQWMIDDMQAEAEKKMQTNVNNINSNQATHQSSNSLEAATDAPDECPSEILFRDSHPRPAFGFAPASSLLQQSNHHNASRVPSAADVPFDKLIESAVSNEVSRRLLASASTAVPTDADLKLVTVQHELVHLRQAHNQLIGEISSMRNTLRMVTNDARSQSAAKDRIIDQLQAQLRTTEKSRAVR